MCNYYIAETEAVTWKKSKYAAQQRYNRKNYVRFPLDLKPDVLEEFRRVCADNGTNPTAEIKNSLPDTAKAAANNDSGKGRETAPFCYAWRV